MPPKVIKLPGGNVTRQTADTTLTSIPEVVAIVGQFSTRPPARPTEPFTAQSKGEFLAHLDIELTVPIQAEPIPIHEVRDLEKGQLIQRIAPLKADALRRKALSALRKAIKDPNDQRLYAILEKTLADPELKAERIAQQRALGNIYRQPDLLSTGNAADIQPL